MRLESACLRYVIEDATASHILVLIDACHAGIVTQVFTPWTASARADVRPVGGGDTGSSVYCGLRRL